jgi:hypothetical protein
VYMVLVRCPMLCRDCEESVVLLTIPGAAGAGASLTAWCSVIQVKAILRFDLDLKQPGREAPAPAATIACIRRTYPTAAV